MDATWAYFSVRSARGTVTEPDLSHYTTPAGVAPEATSPSGSTPSAEPTTPGSGSPAGASPPTQPGGPEGGTTAGSTPSAGEGGGTTPP
jgi:hypothetical protein